MNDISRNPFLVTKAVDLSDDEIDSYWVDLPGTAGFREMARPTSPMPMFITGGKGSGKTHLMRHFSFQLQKLRAARSNTLPTAEGYIGIFLRGGGLNAHRFDGKGCSREVWDSVFAFYMDVFLAQLALVHLSDLCTLIGAPEGWERIIPAEVARCSGVEAFAQCNDLEAVAQILRNWQAEMDVAVNNAAITRVLPIRIRSTPGRLVFGVPQAFERAVPALKGTLVLYLVDELENLDRSQQRYLNTLIREKEAPCSFKIGAKLYGIKTHDTLSAGEKNREGSEFEILCIDDHFRANRNYPRFARELIARRLMQHGLLSGDAGGLEKLAARVPTFFETLPIDRTLGTGAEISVEGDLLSGPVRDFARKLADAREKGTVSGVITREQERTLVDWLAAIHNPLVQKAAMLALYQDWAARRDLSEALLELSGAVEEYQSGSRGKNRIRTTLNHFKEDFVAQLRRDKDLKQLYLGVDTFIEMSRGLPRNLLVILKHVYQWAVFLDEQPFRARLISKEAQRRGVLEASQWFLHDAEVLGEHSQELRLFVDRLAALFREIRFSDKPPECSLITFSVAESSLPSGIGDLLAEAQQWSLIIRIRGGQKDKNSFRVDSKFQLNSMLCPLWDLSVSRRGALSLSAAELSAMFNTVTDYEYVGLKRARLRRMNAPFGIEPAAGSPDQMSLMPHD